MNELTFDILANTVGDCHTAAGIAGLALALESLPKEQQVLQWERDRRSVQVSWTGDFTEAWDYLIRQTFKLLEGGIISLPSCNATTHQGLLATLLQSPATRPKLSVGEIFLDSSYGDVSYPTLCLQSFVHQGFAKKLKTSGVELSGSILPNARGGIKLTLEAAIACLFSPLTWGFYQIQEVYGNKVRYTTALVCPNLSNLDRINFVKPNSAVDFVASSLEDACLHFAGLNDCQVHGFQFFSETANRPARIIAAATIIPIAEYEDVRGNFPNNGGLDKNDKPFVAANQLRGIIAKNLVAGKRWYEDLWRPDFDLLSYEKEGLRSLLDPSKQQRWKDKTNFEASDSRKGYRAGYNAAKRGRTEIPPLPDSEWAEGYKKGFAAVSSKEEIVCDFDKRVYDRNSPLVDPQDQALANSVKGRATANGWVNRKGVGDKQIAVYLHREILKVTGDQSFQVTFKNGDRLDCRRENLILLTMSELRSPT